MTTRLDKAIKREIDFNGVPYTVTLSPEGLKIVEKGKRKGREMTWEELMSGSVSLEHGLRNSVGVAEQGNDEG